MVSAKCPEKTRFPSKFRQALLKDGYSRADGIVHNAYSQNSNIFFRALLA